MSNKKPKLKDKKKDRKPKQQQQTGRLVPKFYEDIVVKGAVAK